MEFFHDDKRWGKNKQTNLLRYFSAYITCLNYLEIFIALVRSPALILLGCFHLLFISLMCRLVSQEANFVHNSRRRDLLFSFSAHRNGIRRKWGVPFCRNCPHSLRLAPPSFPFLGSGLQLRPVVTMHSNSAELHNSTRVLSNGYRERERDCLSSCLPHPSNKKERSITRTRGQKERKKERKKKGRDTHTHATQDLGSSERFNSIGGRISYTDTHTYTGTLRESAKRDPPLTMTDLFSSSRSRDELQNQLGTQPPSGCKKRNFPAAPTRVVVFLFFFF